MYLLDTDHCGRILGGDPALLTRVDDVGESRVATCTIVAGELIYMAHHSEYRASNLSRVRAFLQDIRVYFVDEAPPYLNYTKQLYLIKYTADGHQEPMIK